MVLSPFWQIAGILLFYHCTLVTVEQHSFHVQKGVQIQPKMVRAEGLQRDYQLGRKLLRSGLINCSSVLRTFVDNQGKALCYYCGYNTEVLLDYQHAGK